MKRLAFIKSLFCAPVAVLAVNATPLPQEESCRLFKYQTARGRPFAMFTMPSGKPAQWWYWVFENENKWKLPPKEWKDDIGCVGFPKDWGWKAIEGNPSDMVAGAFVGNDFPDVTRIEHWAQHEFQSWMKLKEA